MRHANVFAAVLYSALNSPTLSVSITASKEWLVNMAAMEAARAVEAVTPTCPTPCPGESGRRLVDVRAHLVERCAHLVQSGGEMQN